MKCHRASITLVAAAAFSLSACALPEDARAADAPKIDFTQVLMNIEGKPFTYCAEYKKAAPPAAPECKDERDMTLEQAALSALQTRFQDEQNLSGADQVRRVSLAIRIHQQKAVALTADDVKLIKDLTAKVGYNPVLVYRAYQLLDPNSIPELGASISGGK